MKVSRLIEILQEKDPNIEVMLSRDPEGNGFWLDVEVGEGWVLDGEKWHTEEFHSDLEELKEEAESYGEVFDESNYRKVVMLWP